MYSRCFLWTDVSSALECGTFLSPLGQLWCKEICSDVPRVGLGQLLWPSSCCSLSPLLNSVGLLRFCVSYLAYAYESHSRSVDFTLLRQLRIVSARFPQASNYRWVFHCHPILRHKMGMKPRWQRLRSSHQYRCWSFLARGSLMLGRKPQFSERLKNSPTCPILRTPWHFSLKPRVFTVGATSGEIRISFSVPTDPSRCSTAYYR